MSQSQSEIIEFACKPNPAAVSLPNEWYMPINPLRQISKEPFEMASPPRNKNNEVFQVKEDRILIFTDENDVTHQVKAIGEGVNNHLRKRPLHVFSFQTLCGQDLQPSVNRIFDKARGQAYVDCTCCIEESDSTVA